MSAETFSYKGISAGKYIEGEIEALNQEEASFKLKDNELFVEDCGSKFGSFLKIKGLFKLAGYSVGLNKEE